MRWRSCRWPVNNGTHCAVVASSSFFLHRYPNIVLQISEGSYPAFDAAVRDGSCDFYVGPLAGNNLAEDVIVEKLFDNRQAILCRRGHPLASSTSLRELVDAKWVTTSVEVDRGSELTLLFEQNGLPAPVVVIETQSALSMLTAVASSDLLAILPYRWLDFAPARALLTHIRLSTPLASLATCLVRRSGLPLTPAAQHLYDLFGRAELSHVDQRLRWRVERDYKSHARAGLLGHSHNIISETDITLEDNPVLVAGP